MLAVLLHLLMDFPTAYGTRLLSPFDWHWFSADLMPIVDIYLLVVLAATLIVGMRTPDARRRNAAIALAFMAANYGVRGVLHHQALAAAPGWLGPERPPLCDARAAASRIDTWPRDWRVTPPPGTPGRCLVEIAAMPDFVSPFRWRVVARFSNAYSVQEVDLLHPAARPDTAWRTARRIPNQWPPEALAAASADVAQVFLGFARFPAVRTFSSPAQTTTVRWIDMRFSDGLPRRNQDPRAAGLFAATVTLRPDGTVIAQRLGQ